MKRLPFVLLLILVASLPAVARQKGDKTEATASPADKRSPITRIKEPAAEVGWIVNYRQDKSDIILGMPDGGRPSTSSTPFVIVDGAVYISMPVSGVLVPMSGGGASGCFTLDLPQRIKNLRKLTEEFPPRGGSEPAIRQLEAYAM